MQIIGGPSIRRVENNVAYIWLVTDTKPQEITISGGISHLMNDTSIIAQGGISSADVVALGDNIFAALLPLKHKNDEYPKDTKIYYDISIDGESLEKLGLFKGAKSILYKGEKLPSFFIPKKHNKILQGSCRKPHAGKPGHKQFDQMHKIDTDIASSMKKPLKERPSLLCLTGDQIYADDVAAPLLAALKTEAFVLTGWDELMPHRSDSSKTINPSKIKLGKRDATLPISIGFTSGKKENHLMTFGEYVVMYLVAFGGLSVEIPDYSSQRKNIGTINNRKKTYKPRGRPTTPIYSKYVYNKQKGHVEAFLKDSWRMRRVMANTPTYMIFDDHEVTDDWNLTKENRDNLKSNPLSKRIQANALAAYWVCQGWGNNPLDTDFSKTFKTNLSNYLSSKSPGNAASYVNGLINKKYWGYEVSGYPYIFVLDTRSDRKFVKGQFSQLMSPKRIDLLAASFRKMNQEYKDDIDNQSVLLISPAPVLGFKSIEFLQMKFKSIPTTVDGEPWIGSAKAYENLLKALREIKCKHCSVISGDVHYSYVRRLALGRLDLSPLIVNQYTSSALHNAPNGKVRILLNLLAKAERTVFNRGGTPYVFPNNIPGKDEFICGHTSYGLLELDNGTPSTNTYFFKDASKNKTFKWKYLIDTPKQVHFPDSNDIYDDDYDMGIN